MAKYQEDTAKIGYVGAFPYAEVICGFTSFYLGAKSCLSFRNNGSKIYKQLGIFDLEKECAEQLIADGCVLISQHADTTGAPTACEAKKVPCVGYNIDMIPTAPDAALTSATITGVLITHMQFRVLLMERPSRQTGQKV